MKSRASQRNRGVLDGLIDLSCSVAALHLDREEERKVAEGAMSLGISIEAQALALWLLGSRAATRYPGPIDDVLRFSEWILSGRSSHI